MSPSRAVLVSALILIVVIAAVHVNAMTYRWYFVYWWLDIPMHFLGGAWIALAMVWAFLSFKQLSGFRRIFLAILLSVLIVGVGWEIFEYKLGERFFIEHETYAIDTSIDLFMDILGGVVVYAIINFFYSLHRTETPA